MPTTATKQGGLHLGQRHGRLRLVLPGGQVERSRGVLILARHTGSFSVPDVLVVGEHTHNEHAVDLGPQGDTR